MRNGINKKFMLPIVLGIVYMALVGLIIYSDDIMVSLNNNDTTAYSSDVLQPSLQVNYAGNKFFVYSEGPDITVRRAQ